MSVTHITECRLCDGSDLDLVVSFTPTPLGDHYITADRLNEPQPCYPLDVLCCRGCGAVQLADTVDPSLIYPEYLYTTSVSRGLAEHFSTYASAVVRTVQPKLNDLAIDIGSNDGTLLRAFQGHGCRVLGVDPALAIATSATAAGIQTYCGFFTRLEAEAFRLEHGRAQIITANHVMANVPDLHDFIEGVKHLLAKDGTFVFETGYWPAIVANNLIDVIEHEHIHYFAVAPLKRFFARHGLVLVSVEVQPTKGGSLRGYVQHSYDAEADESVETFTASEHPYMDLKYLHQWAHQIERLRQEIRRVLTAKNGQAWVGYGAAVGSTLLLHHFGLGEHLECLIDDNPAKQGRFSPGYHLPVCAPDALDRQPDNVVILAWRYAEMIRQQHPEFAGKYLIPLPTWVQA